MKIEKIEIDKIIVYRIKNEFLEVDIVPEIGGRIIGIRDLKSNHQFLWKNNSLKLNKLPVGSPYDPNFYGGIDELLPNDMPESINGISFPDHGELWTMGLDCEIIDNNIHLFGTLPLSGLKYEKIVTLCLDEPKIQLKYNITNTTFEERTFLWKFHAALGIEPSDEIICPAKTAKVADLEYSRWKEEQPFNWPFIHGERADIIPENNDTTDFLYLYDLSEGYMGWRSNKKNLAFLYEFDNKVFPYCWYFASYGGFLNHYTAVLEPCTTMPISVVEAAKMNQCSVLKSGETISTSVYIYAGEECQIKKHLGDANNNGK